MLIKDCPKNEYPKPDGQEPWCELEDPDNLGGSSCDGCDGDGNGGHSAFGDTEWFWSSSSYVGYPGLAWSASFNNGYVGYMEKASYYYARCVK
jgi:hypothetical protein